MSNIFYELLKLYKSPFIITIVILGVLSAIFYKKIVGKAGEIHVINELKKLSKDYLIINDLMIKTDDRTSQIDHVIISKYGIFIIETKKYNGYITGNNYDKKWKYKSCNKTYYINNPVHQNYGHVESIKKVLNITNDIIIPIVSISDTAKLNIKSKQVVNLRNLISYIEQYNKEILSNPGYIYSKLLSLNITDKKQRKEHMKNIKKSIRL